MSSKPRDSALQQDISAIEEKRQVLEQIVKIAQTIEHMQVGLESVLVLGVPSKDIPDDALDLYNSISDNLRNLPVTKIREYLKNLEAIIKKQLKQILHYSGTDPAFDESIELLFVSGNGSNQGPLELLEDFKRTAQTAVSLRVLLRRRGVASEGSSLPVSCDKINRQIAHLEFEEQQQRSNIRRKVSGMKEDIANMIDNPAYPEGLKEILNGVQRNLDKDLKSIDMGLKLSSLSFVTDASEITGIRNMSLDETPSEQSEHEKEISLAEAARVWLNTPWDVTWKEVRHKH